MDARSTAPSSRIEGSSLGLSRYGSPSDRPGDAAVVAQYLVGSELACRVGSVLRGLNSRVAPWPSKGKAAACGKKTLLAFKS